MSKTLGQRLADFNIEGFAIGGGYTVANERLQVDYVHELQHLLRLCGVEKELTI